MAGPAEFIRQVKVEGSKITWPTRKETVTASIMVLVVVVLFSAFFFGVDFVVAYLVKLILGLNF